MGIKIRIRGNEIEARDYTVQESGTPLAAGDSRGGTGVISFSIPRPDPDHLHDSTRPIAKLLSIGMSDVRVIRDEDGLWNKLTPQDREEAFRALEKEAEKKFANSNLVSESLYAGEKRIQEVLKDSGARLKIEAAKQPQK